MFDSDSNGSLIVSKILACQKGFVKDDKCVNSCGPGYYGYSSFDERGLIIESKCL